MSDVNKLDSKKCSFSPDGFKASVDNVAPVGSFPWAMIQVYLGNNVRRNAWDANIYIYGDNIGKDDQAVKQGNKEGTFAWNPEQQDMLACDWSLLKIEPKPVTCPEGTMLSFDLTIGTSQYNNGGGQDWGYLTTGGHFGGGESTFGTLTNFQNTLGIGSILEFYAEGTPTGPSSHIGLLVDTQNQPNLGSKNLEVMVNGSTYNLGSSPNATTSFRYTSDGAKQLGDLLKQNLGKTLHFCFNWK